VGIWGGRGGQKKSTGSHSEQKKAKTQCAFFFLQLSEKGNAGGVEGTNPHRGVFGKKNRWWEKLQSKTGGLGTTRNLPVHQRNPN